MRKNAAALLQIKFHVILFVFLWFLWPAFMSARNFMLPPTSKVTDHFWETTFGFTCFWPQTFSVLTSGGSHCHIFPRRHALTFLWSFDTLEVLVPLPRVLAGDADIVRTERTWLGKLGCSFLQLRLCPSSFFSPQWRMDTQQFRESAFSRCGAPVQQVKKRGVTQCVGFAWMSMQSAHLLVKNYTVSLVKLSFPWITAGSRLTINLQSGVLLESEDRLVYVLVF